MSEDDDVVVGETETSIAFVIDRVSEEDTSDRSGCQFMRCLGGVRGWDSRRNGTPASAHRRVQHRGERHRG
jgi:hypothetical protein